VQNFMNLNIKKLKYKNVLSFSFKYKFCTLICVFCFLSYFNQKSRLRVSVFFRGKIFSEVFFLSSDKHLKGALRIVPPKISCSDEEAIFFYLAWCCVDSTLLRLFNGVVRKWRQAYKEGGTQQFCEISM